ncbi:hypothetical protein Glove_482g8 [Diversispora epigaea]|uniref:Uncharacterized protein n=1 Tax=Diversispora epigaea TaxID=1348612 RepID=A0A397GNU7_9GLOM|nr:hypothetical protein Glove_482g8 [Diversispora epigaea]
MAGKAKTAIDSHHAQISQAIKRYIKLGYDINSGDDIESAIKNIAGTRVANLNPNRDNDKAKLGTITGISNYQEWTWPTDEENSGYIFARALPGIGEWKIWSTEKIEKIIKKRKIEKPNPIYSQPSELNKLWTMPINPVLVDITNITNQEIVEIPTSRDSPSETNDHRNQKIIGNNVPFWNSKPRQKLNAQQMHEEQQQRARADFPRFETNDHRNQKIIGNNVPFWNSKPRQKLNAQQMHEEQQQRARADFPRLCSSTFHLLFLRFSGLFNAFLRILDKILIKESD